MPLPKGVKVIEIATTTGDKLRFPTLETAKLGELTKALESRALQTLDGVKKAINLPAWSKLTYKLEEDGKTIHLINNHTINGKGYQQSIAAGGRKGIYPEWMSEKQIFKSIREAYENSKKVETQIINGEKKVRLVGQSGNLTIEMWVNLTTDTLETAYPKGGIK